MAGTDVLAHAILQQVSGLDGGGLLAAAIEQRGGACHAVGIGARGVEGAAREHGAPRFPLPPS